MSKRWFLLRLVVFALTRRKSRVAIALAAVVLGVAIVSALASVYYDIGQKMTRELRTYGANLVLTPSAKEKQLSLVEVSTVASKVPSAQMVGYAPYLYGVVNGGSRQLLLAGTNFAQAVLISPYWKINGSAPAEGSRSAVVGEALAKKLGVTTGDKLELVGETGTAVGVAITGILTTGGKEDNLILVDLALAAGLLNRADAASVAYFSVAASPAQLESLVQSLRNHPGIEASLIRQVSQAEGQVLVKVQLLVLLAVVIILLLTLLCVAITMTNIALERYREIGLRKALGGQNRQIMLEFVIEGAILGLAGGIIGWSLGLLVAQGIGLSVFDAAIPVRLPILPLAVVLATGLGALAALIPARVALGVQPSTVLRGE